MRIFHQRLLAAKVLISDNEADEIVFRAVSFDIETCFEGSRRIEGSLNETQTANIHKFSWLTELTEHNLNQLKCSYLIFLPILKKTTIVV